MEVKQIMITDKEFSAFLNDKSLDCHLKEKLASIIDEEMEKPEKEMDTGLIEYCLDALAKIEEKTTDGEEYKKGKGDSNGKHIKLTLKKIIAIAAAIAVLLVGSISTSAIVFNVNLFDSIVELYNDYIRINFDKTDDKSDNHQLLGNELIKELSDKGFNEVLLPEAIFSDEYSITKIEYETVEYINSVNITFQYKNKPGVIYITKYSMSDMVPDIEFLNVTSDIETINVSDVTAYCFMQGKSASINYKDGLTLYTIQIPTNLENSLEIAKTIK